MGEDGNEILKISENTFDRIKFTLATHQLVAILSLVTILIMYL